ncbi:MAG: hypothetical protein ACOYYS_02405 [Chloroflexota bacterium]
MPKYDGVIEAVHYTPDGQVAWVRAYERRGPAFSDRVLIDRASLVEKLEQGKRFMLGRRIESMAGSFDVSVPVRLVRQKDGVLLASDHLQHTHDSIEGVPVI